MWTAKLRKYEGKIVGVLTIAAGIFHGLSYCFKIEKCKLCGNYVYGFWVDVFHRTNYALWYLLFYTILISGYRKWAMIYLFGGTISEYLFVNEFFGNPKDWGVAVSIGFVAVLAFTFFRYKKSIY